MNNPLGHVIAGGIFIAIVLDWCRAARLGSRPAWSVLIAALASVPAAAGLWWAIQPTADAAAAVRERFGRAD